MNNDFKDYKDFTNKEKVKNYINKWSNITQDKFNNEQVDLILSIFSNYGDNKKEFLLMRIAELIIKFHKVGKGK